MFGLPSTHFWADSGCPKLRFWVPVQLLISMHTRLCVCAINLAEKSQNGIAWWWEIFIEFAHFYSMPKHTWEDFLKGILTITWNYILLGVLAHLKKDIWRRKKHSWILNGIFLNNYVKDKCSMFLSAVFKNLIFLCSF